MAELDEILSGAETEPEGQPRGEDGRFIPTTPPVESTPEPEPTPQVAEDPPPAATPVAEPPEERVPQAALLDERRKRQQYERELAELREQLRAKETPPEPAKPPADVWSDPEGYISAAEKRAAELAESRVSQRLAHVEANISERLARREHADYDEKRTVFMERLASDPVLKSEFNRHLNEGGDLGEFVYETAGRLQELQEVRSIGSIQAYREKIAAEVRAQILAERSQPSAVPQSLNVTPSPATSTETWSGPPPLDEILKRK